MAFVRCFVVGLGFFSLHLLQPDLLLGKGLNSPRM